MSVPLVYKEQAVTKCYNSRLLYIRIWISKKQKVEPYLYIQVNVTIVLSLQMYNEIITMITMV